MLVVELCELAVCIQRCCAHCVEGLFEVDDCDPQRLAPLGGSLSELLERQKVVYRGEAQSEVGSVIGLIVVQFGLWSLEEELAKEFVQERDRTNGSEVRS